MGVLDRFMCMPFMGCNRQVDTFDRRQCGLERVPEEIKAYKNTLEELLLDENLFDKLPEFLFTLHKLRILGLSGNKLTEISHDISKLTNLEDLNLHENELFAFPTGIFLCRQLRVFDISKNHIIQLPSEITQLTSLTHLNLNDISLATLPADIGHLYNLRSFEIRENFIKTLPPSVGCLTKLERLDIGQNEIYHLPIEIGGLVSLVEFYADENLLTEIPEEISCCQALEQLDVSQNKLLDLPETLGDLSKLTDLAVAQNSLTQFPASIGKLSKLQHLKAEKNDLNVLTPGIARCRELAELHLSENRLAELPSALGNLSKLKVLIVDKNELRSIPSQLGSCGSMTILSIRSNEIRELPMEIGKLSNLTVLDVSNNKLSFLPFTISVLGKLSAIWLDEGQSQGMVKLCEGRDPKTNMKVMTCYLLPQRANGQGDDNRRQPSTGFTDGPRVHFGEEDEPKESIGNFERQNTPHPKPQGQKTKSKKGGDDVHLVPNEVQQNGKPLPEPTPQPMPRSALKKPTANGTEQPSTSSLNQSMTQSATQQFNPSLTKSQKGVRFNPNKAWPESTTIDSSSEHSSNDDDTKEDKHMVTFDDSVPDDETRVCKLKRTMTPYVKKMSTYSVASITSDIKSEDDNISSGFNSTITKSSSKSVKMKVSSDDGVHGDSESECSSTEGTKDLLSTSDSNDKCNVTFDDSVPDNEQNISKLKRTKTPKRFSMASMASTSSDKSVSFDRTVFDNEFSPHSLTRQKTPHYSKTVRPFKMKIGDTPQPDSSSDFSSNEENKSRGGEKALNVTFDETIPDNEARVCKLKRTMTPHIKKCSTVSLVSVASNRSVEFDDTCPDNEFVPHSLTRQKTPHYSKTERPFSLKVHLSSDKEGDVSFDDTCVDNEKTACKLKRKNTPFIKKEKKSDLVSMSRGSASIRISITKDPSGMGLSIAGGLESEPYKENDSGIFVSKVIPGGAGQKAGLKVGDRIIGVNGFTAINANHKEIVEYMKNSINVIVLDILRDLSSNVEQVSTPLVRSPDQSFNTSIDNSRPEKHTYIITRDSHGSPGFSIVGGQGSTNEENIIVSHVSYGSQAEKRGMRVGDQIVSINNTNVRKIRHDQAVSLLTGSPGDEVIIATERDRSIVSPVTSPITTPLPPVLNVPFGRVVSPQSLLYGDPSWDNKTEQVDLYRPTGSSLGLSVVGGSDVCSHPFGKGNHGAFVSKIIPNSPAGSCGRLRLGDRILNVNNKDLKNAKHEEVINTMKSSGNVIKLGVLHEPQPQGLKEVFFTRTDPDKLGLYICGGTDAPPANPNVANDDGIFIDKIDIHSCCFGIKDLYPGVRILEVNDDSLLGCTQVQAAEYLKKAGHRIRLLICQGYTKSTTPTPEPQISPSTNTLVAPPTSTIPQNDGLVEEKKILITDASSSLTPPTLQTPASHLHNNLDNDIEDAVPLNTSTPIPPPAEEAIPKLITKIPPPVAPKPSVNISAQEDPHQFSLITNLEKPPKVIDSSNYDSVASFSSKLKKFESESNGSATTILNTKKSTYSTIPSKKPLLTQDEVKKIKEEELRKMQDINFTNQNQFPSPIAESTFDQYVSKIPQPVNGLTKTKKVENNLTQVPNGFSEPVDSITQKRLDIQRNIEFRQARLKDTDSDEVFAQSAEVLNSFSRITSRMENRSEAGSIPSTPIPGH
uniref:PDZ domain-containing protein n=1 Tax=Rhabditophanes sp. KR3021 TaxID=114890 RepID=A0AC35TQY8_9BILA